MYIYIEKKINFLSNHAMVPIKNEKVLGKKLSNTFMAFDV